MATDYEHVLYLLQDVLPHEDWKTIHNEWDDFSQIYDGDNEPFRLMRSALTKLMAARKSNERTWTGSDGVVRQLIR